MATREENLEKIKCELEKLDDEQLEQVAGGFCSALSLEGKEIALKCGIAHSQQEKFGREQHQQEQLKASGRIF